MRLLRPSSLGNILQPVEKCSEQSIDRWIFVWKFSFRCCNLRICIHLVNVSLGPTEKQGRAKPKDFFRKHVVLWISNQCIGSAGWGAFKGGCEQTGGRFRCVSAPYCLRSLEVQKMLISLSEWEIIGDQWDLHLFRTLLLQHCAIVPIFFFWEAWGAKDVSQVRSKWEKQ